MRGTTSYNGLMTDDDLWKRVGEELLIQRNRRQWDLIDVERNGGPSSKTVLKIEQGDIARLDMLKQHVAVFGLTVVDVLRSVLEVPGITNPEIAHVVAAFERTTVAGRQALVALSRALPDEPRKEAAPGRLRR